MISAKGTLITLLLLCLCAPGASQEIRQRSVLKLSALGFKVSPSLPTERALTSLRPQAEIEARLDALHALVMWVAAPDGIMDYEALQQSALSGDLSPWLTQTERDVFRLPRSQAKELHLDAIGWKMENMWALAWVLGYPEAPALSGELQGDLARDIVFNYCLKGERELRAVETVLSEEDLFYCAHNAVRSAQLGEATVPANFDPKQEGGGIHERRHALTWCLSPGVSWEETDLSS